MIVRQLADDHFSITLAGIETDPVRMLQVTDLHLGQKGLWRDDLTSFRRIRRLVEMHDPHVIAITGDLLTGEKYFGELLCAFAVEFFDSLARPWLYVFGNHDPEGGMGRDEIAEVFNASDWGVLGRHPVDGEMGHKYDYRVELKARESDQTVWDIFGFDTGSEKSFQSIKEDQLDWYRGQSVDGIPAIALTHIPFRQYQDLWDDPDIPKCGQSKETVCYEEDDGSAYEALVDVGNIKAVFCGHDHYNTYWGTYHGGITLAYGHISGECTNWAWPTGGKLITLSGRGGKVSIENVTPESGQATSE